MHLFILTWELPSDPSTLSIFVLIPFLHGLQWRHNWAKLCYILTKDMKLFYMYWTQFTDLSTELSVVSFELQHLRGISGREAFLSNCWLGIFLMISGVLPGEDKNLRRGSKSQRRWHIWFHILFLPKIPLPDMYCRRLQIMLWRKWSQGSHKAMILSGQFFGMEDWFTEGTSSCPPISMGACKDKHQLRTINLI